MAQNIPNPSSGFGRAIKSILRTLFRLLLALVAGVIIGAALYYGGYLLYTQLRNYQAGLENRISNLEAGRSSTSQRLESSMESINERLAEVEHQQMLDRESLSSLEAGYGSLQQAITSQTGTLEKLTRLEAELENMKGFLGYEATQVAGLVVTQTAPDSPILSLQNEIKVLQAMELLGRARLYLLQSNYGLAAEDVRSARGLVQELQEQAPLYQQDMIQTCNERLERVLTSLPASPVQAAGDLEVAWEMLSQGLPSQPVPASFSGGTAQPEITGSPALSITPTRNITSTPTITPTPR